MSKTQLTASRALWRTRELRAYTAWRRTVALYKPDNANRARTFKTYQTARTNRRHRDAQLAALKGRAIVHVSAAGLRFISQHEGVIPYAYNDSRGFATAWIGHLIAQRPVNAADRLKWGTPAKPATYDRIIAYFKTDLAGYEKAVAAVWAEAIRRGHKGPSQKQFDADVSFCFNIGVNGFTGSLHAHLIRDGAKRAEQAAAMMQWLRPVEITGRRTDERDLFMGGSY